MYKKMSMVRMMILIAVVGVLVSMIITFLVSDDVEDARKVAEEFIQKTMNGQFDEAKEFTTQSYDLQSMFGGENIILSYSNAGFGGGIDSAVWLDYLVDGLPAQTRNISFKVINNDGNWIIEQIYISYHIDRQDKQLVEDYIYNMVMGDVWKAYEILTNVFVNIIIFKKLQNLFLQVKLHNLLLIFSFP